MLEDVAPGALGFWLVVLVLAGGVVLWRLRPEEPDRWYTIVLLGVAAVPSLVLCTLLLDQRAEDRSDDARVRSHLQSQLRELEERIRTLEPRDAVLDFQGGANGG